MEKVCPDVWKKLYSYQQLGLLCDVQLQVLDDATGSSETFPCHRLILASSSAYFQESIVDSGQYQELYFLDGSSSESVSLVLKYIYRQIDYLTLQRNCEAFRTAEALQIIQHSDEETKIKSETSQKEDANFTIDVNPSENNQKLLNLDSSATNSPVFKSVFCQTESADKPVLSISTEKPPPAQSHSSNILTKQEKAKKAQVAKHSPRKVKNRITDDEVVVREKTPGKLCNQQVSCINSAPCSSVRRSGRTPKLSQKMKEYVSLKVEANENAPSGDENNEELELGEISRTTDISLSFQSPTVQVFTLNVAKSKPKNPAGSNVITVSNNTTSSEPESGENQQPHAAEGNILEEVKMPMEAKSKISESEENHQHAVMEIVPVEHDNQSEVEEFGENDCTVKEIVPEKHIRPESEENGQHTVKEIVPETHNNDNIQPESPKKLEKLNNGNDHGLFCCSKCPMKCATQSLLSSHIRRVHEGPLICGECGKKFTRQMHYIDHMRNVHNKAPFECKECNLKFHGKSGYLYHRNRHHSTASGEDVLKFACQECGKKFFLKSELTSHMIFKHSDERPFVCDVSSCQRTFKHKKDLHRHSATYHSLKRDHVCSECNRAFKTAEDLKRHLKLHENGKTIPYVVGKRFPDGQNYPCSFCDKTFTKRTQQKTHERLQHTQKDTGTSYLCTACNRSFAIKHYLMQHIKHVHMARRHQCNKCERMFMQNHDLNRHLPRCKGKSSLKKPFVCPNCSQGFTMKANLAKHMQIPGRCKWQRNNISDLVVLVQDNGSNLEEEMATSNEGAENVILEESTVTVPEVALESEDGASCDMSLINIATEGGQLPVFVRSVDGKESIINISDYPGAEFILESVETPEAAVETVIQMPAIQNEMEVDSEEVLVTTDSQNVIISSDDSAVLHAISETEAVPQSNIQ